MVGSLDDLVRVALSCGFAVAHRKHVLRLDSWDEAGVAWYTLVPDLVLGAVDPGLGVPAVVVNHHCLLWAAHSHVDVASA